MSQVVSQPQIVRCYFEDGFRPRLPAMCLHWEEGVDAERLWQLPGGLCLWGPPPERFGVRIRRRGPDAYAVRLLWGRTRMTWQNLPREELLSSSLGELLEALGTDLWYLLDQPVRKLPLDPEHAA